MAPRSRPAALAEDKAGYYAHVGSLAHVLNFRKDSSLPDGANWAFFASWRRTRDNLHHSTFI
jgi:hypothetical protein